MSQDNVELVLRSMGHRLAGRFAEWVDTLTPDIGWDISAYPLPDWPDTGKGRDAFVRHMSDYFAGWTDYAWTIDEVADAGDYVVVILREQARMGSTGTVLERQLPIIWTVGDGTVEFFRVFKAPEDALKAVGLEE